MAEGRDHQRRATMEDDALASAVIVTVRCFHGRGMVRFGQFTAMHGWYRSCKQVNPLWSTCFLLSCLRHIDFCKFRNVLHAKVSTIHSRCRPAEILMISSLRELINHQQVLQIGWLGVQSYNIYNGRTSPIGFDMWCSLLVDHLRSKRFLLRHGCHASIVSAITVSSSLVLPWQTMAVSRESFTCRWQYHAN